jgi:hypothetical protein
MGSRKTDKSAEVKDEPGAEERFKGILKRALHTPPPRKQESSAGTKRARSARPKK